MDENKDVDIKSMVSVLDEFAVKLSSDGKLDAGEAADLLDATTGVCAAFAPMIMEAFQTKFMDLAHAAGENKDETVGEFCTEIWSSLKVIPNAFAQMVDVSRQVRNRLAVVERLGAENEDD